MPTRPGWARLEEMTQRAAGPKQGWIDCFLKRGIEFPKEAITSSLYLLSLEMKERGFPNRADSLPTYVPSLNSEISLVGIPSSLTLCVVLFVISPPLPTWSSPHSSYHHALFPKNPPSIARSLARYREYYCASPPFPSPPLPSIGSASMRRGARRPDCC